MNRTLKNLSFTLAVLILFSNISVNAYSQNEPVKNQNVIVQHQKSILEKGKLLPATYEPTKAVFDLKTLAKSPFELKLKKKFGKQKISTKTKDWSLINSENFEGTFPSSGWSTYSNNTSLSAYWDDTNYMSYSGSWSVWCAKGGSNGVNPASYYYYNNMNAWMVYGPFDLSDATAGDLSFYLNNNSESGYDYFKYMVSVDGVNYSGYQTSGTTSGWTSEYIDFTNVYSLGNVCGYHSVYIALVFTSDGSNNSYTGPFVDDIVIEKSVPNLKLIDFETIGQNWNWYSFGNGDNASNLYSVASNPNPSGINTSSNCARYIVNSNAVTYAGLYSYDIGNFTFTSDNCIVKIKVNKSLISNFDIKFENSDASVSFEKIVSNTIINQWQELTYDFSAYIGKTISKLIIVPDFPSIRTSSSINYWDDISFNSIGTAVNSLHSNNEIYIYHNSTTGKFEISEIESLGKDCTVEVYNNTGKSVFTSNLDVLNSKISLDLSTFPIGMYIVRLSNNGISYQGKLIKK